MRIRSIEDRNEQLQVWSDEQGDIYVNVFHESDIYRENHIHTVRIGGAGSGHEVPPKIRSLLLQVADEFKKYSSCIYESDAMQEYLNESNI